MGNSSSGDLPTRNSSQCRLWLLATLITSLACFATLVAFEIGLRVYRGGRFFFPHQPNSLQIFYPSEEITPGVTDPSFFSTNSYGTRGPELHGETVRILTVGGSTTACTVLDDSETWPHLLMEELNRDSDGRVWVTNSGMDGKNSEHHLMHAIYLLPRLPRLDFVLVYAGLNDVGSWLYKTEYDSHFLEKPENWDSRVGESFRASSYTPTSQPAYKRLHLWKMASQVKAWALTWRNQRTRAQGVILQDAELSWLEEERAARRERKKSFVHRAKMETLPDALANYADNLTRIVDEVRTQGAEPVLVAQAMAAQLWSEQEREHFWMGAMDGGETYVKETQMLELVATFNAEMNVVATERNVIFVDLPTALPRDQNLFFDGVHFNEIGARVIAHILADELREPIRTRLSAIADNKRFTDSKP